ncbi:MAG: protein translocase SEC61 complex subunit gamma [Desulfurococcaceae archaeon]|uniref:Protein translocase subunit SecE n=1 Tax=Staphylothermus marinus TaxID=2280 RepID=A0A7C4HCK2_STAMA
MGFREIIDAWRRILKLASKPDREEYMINLKMSLLGLFLVGVIAFIIRFLIYTYVFPPFS